MAKNVPLPVLVDWLAPKDQSSTPRATTLLDRASHYTHAPDDVGWGDATKFLGLNAQVPRIRQSVIETWLSCPRKFLFRHRFGLAKKRVERVAALDIGIFFHALMAGYHEGRTEAEVVSEIGMQIEAIVARADELENAAPYGDPVRVLRMQNEMEQNLLLARAMAANYQRRYPVDPQYKTIAVEETITVRHSRLPLLMEGTLDRVLEEVSTGDLWIRDYKTLSNTKSSTGRVASVEWDPQSRIYRLLAASKYADRKVRGFILSVIKKPEIRLSAADRDFELVERVLTRDSSKGRKGDVITEKVYHGPPLFENYLRRVNDWYDAVGDYADKRDEWVEDPPILEAWVRFDEPLMAREFQSLLAEVGRACRAKPMLHKYYRNAKACVIGRWQCEFLPLCRSRPATWKTMIGDQFEVVDKT